MKKLNVVFCGTPDFSVPTLEMLFEHPHINIVGVVTMPDRPVGRGLELQAPPVAEFAKNKKLQLFQTENINKNLEILDFFEKANVDFILVLAFAQFLGSKILNLPRLGAFNIHTSILPKYRGAAPIQYALLNGDKTTGVSIQKMVKEMDAGDLVLFKEINISPTENGGQLYTRLKFEAALSTCDLIFKILNNQLTFTPQDPKGVSFAPTLKKEDGLINFKNSNFEKINNQIRALDPWPGTYCFLGKERLKIFSLEKAEKKLSPGEVSTEFGMLLVGTLDGSVRITKLQLAGKKITTDIEFLNGMKNKNSTIIINPDLV
jgi:methionyl-tRNA formyltransferase